VVGRLSTGRFEEDSMLIIRDLVKIYPGPVTALAGVDLNVPNGMFGLLGPNGAGKTTLMRILAGLLEPSSGTATLDGKPILDHPEEIWGQLGYLPQDFGFFPHLTGEKMQNPVDHGGDCDGERLGRANDRCRSR
jgi:ABC-type multidrug transport system ATPase subunit